MAPESGAVNLSGRLQNDTANYSCSPGFEMIGNGIRTCINGQWNLVVPQCLRKSIAEMRAINSH